MTTPTGIYTRRCASLGSILVSREPSGEPGRNMNSKGGPVHVVAWRVDALFVKVWERVGASNARWCRPFLYLLILRDLLALLAGFPLGWLASDFSLLIPQSQCLSPSCRGRRGDTSRPFAEAILEGNAALPAGAARTSSYLRGVCGRPQY